MASFEKKFNNAQNARPEKAGFVDMPPNYSKDGKDERSTIIPQNVSRSIKYNCRLNKRAVCVLVLVLVVCGLVWWFDEDDPSEEGTMVDVFIVEENQEVLQYWYSEAEHGVIKKSGNTLIHIDAHSDMAPPTVTEQFPFFTWPKNQLQVFEMMQTNDVFISAAASTGLIDQLVWIYPSWDKKLGSTKVTYLWTLGRVANTNNICECMSPYSEDGALMVEKGRCGYLPDDGIEVNISRTACEIKRSINVIHLPGTVALGELQKGTLVPKTKPVLLDVDQCYFGWERGLQVLEHAGLADFETRNIQRKVKKMICARQHEHEHMADKLIKDYINEYINTCGMTSPDKVCQVEHKTLEKTLDPIIEKTFRKEPFMFCGNGLLQNLRNAHELLGILRFLNTKKLNAILNMGFCLRTSPASVSFNMYMGNFGLCFGENIPNDAGLIFHTPSKTELTKSMEEFYLMMDDIIKLNVNLVSVVRSVRSGYTPRHLASRIEDGILSYFRIQSTEGDVEYLENYDRNLLGGAEGWEGRYKYKHRSKAQRKSKSPY